MDAWVSRPDARPLLPPRLLLAPFVHNLGIMEKIRRFDPEEIDLAAVARELRATLGAPIEGAIVGRTVVRDAVAQQLQCSLLEAEQLVDTMIGRGFLIPTETSGGLTVWRFSVEA